MMINLYHQKWRNYYKQRVVVPGNSANVPFVGMVSENVTRTQRLLVTSNYGIKFGHGLNQMVGYF